jgi:hypothetical protein
MTAALIRRATLRDLPDLEIMQAAAWQERGGFDPAPNVPHSYRVATNLIEAGLVFVAAVNDSIGESLVGTLMLDAKRGIWNPGAVHLESVHYWVDPDYRETVIDGVPLGLMLLYAARSLADHAGVRLHIRVETPDRANAVLRMLEINGGEFIGGTVVFAPNTATPDVNTVDKAA